MIMMLVQKVKVTYLQEKVKVKVKKVKVTVLQAEKLPLQYFS